TNLSCKFLRGTLYLILLELAKLDFEINNVEDLSIDETGREVTRSPGMLDCVKITCTKRGENNPRNVYYVRADLNNDNKLLINLFNFMKKQPFQTYFKSASYAIWDRTLSKIREFILNNSQFILQDDTGVPFVNFNNKKWTKYAFGTYTEPNLPNLFRKYKQPQMADYFEKHQKASIPFKMGYGFYNARPNLLLAIPKNAPSLDKDEFIRDVEQLKEYYNKLERCENCGHDIDEVQENKNIEQLQ
ncbi:MAG: hypothetical protein IJ730_04845, partial [Alphaproteobacteria bacterium]|nr:hypothetical protein [Alphaproteobacteria bacterium]